MTRACENALERTVAKLLDGVVRRRYGAVRVASLCRHRLECLVASPAQNNLSSIHGRAGSRRCAVCRVVNRCSAGGAGNLDSNLSRERSAARSEGWRGYGA